MLKFLAALGIIDFFQFLKKTINDLLPKTWDSWQALVWFSVYSWFIAGLAQSSEVQIIISFGAWVFLIPGLHWAMHKEKVLKEIVTVGGIFLAPWVTGVLVCTFLFGSLTGRLTEASFILWAPVSAIIAALPKFVKSGPSYGFPDPPVRQDLIIMFLVNVLISCWFQLYFTTQSWLSQYPSLLAEDFSRSAFVVRLFPEGRQPPRGERILEEAAKIFERRLVGLPWSQTEQWLIQIDQEMGQIEADAIARLTQIPENNLWRLRAQALSGQEYLVQLLSVWQGPTIDGTGYYFAKSCRIQRQPGSPLVDLRPLLEQRNRRRPLEPALLPQLTEGGVTQVQCGPTEGPISGQAPPLR